MVMYNQLTRVISDWYDPQGCRKDVACGSVLMTDSGKLPAIITKVYIYCYLDSRALASYSERFIVLPPPHYFVRFSTVLGWKRMMSRAHARIYNEQVLSPDFRLKGYIFEILKDFPIHK